MKPRHRGTGRDFPDRRDLLVAQPLNLGVIPDVTELLRQRLHGRLDISVG
jgi:hypothetical protein